MTSPAIIPMRPGEVPTEPGWYVHESKWSGRQIIRVIMDNGHPYEETPGSRERMAPVGSLTFIARIFPDRIGEEG